MDAKQEKQLKKKVADLEKAIKNMTDFTDSMRDKLDKAGNGSMAAIEQGLDAIKDDQLKLASSLVPAISDLRSRQDNVEKKAKRDTMAQYWQPVAILTLCFFMGMAVGAVIIMMIQQVVK